MLYTVHNAEKKAFNISLQFSIRDCFLLEENAKHYFEINLK